MRSVSASRLSALLGPAPLARPAYASLADGIRHLVADGRLLVGTRLPSERDLVDALGLSRTTVIAALDRLRTDGFVVTRRGSGSVVALPGPDRAHKAGGSDGLLPRVVPPDVIDLTYAALPASPGTSSAFEWAMTQLPRLMATSGYDPLGLPEARYAIARWYESRGLPTDPEQIVVTCGAHAALVATLRTLLDPGGRVIIESPSYPNAIVGLRRSGLRPIAVPVDHLGWDVTAFGALARESGARVAYLIPDFQNPTGALMPDAQREDLAHIARREGVQLVVDETFVELALDATPPPPLAAWDPSAISIGSASKAYWGGLRIGWLRAPRHEVAALLAARHSLDLGTPILEQLVVASLLETPGLMGERRTMVRAMRDALVGSLRRHVPDWTVPMPPGGLSLWCGLPLARGDELARVAEEHGVRIARGTQFAPESRMARNVRMPTCVPPDLCDELGQRVARAWEAASARPLTRTRGVRHRSTRSPVVV